MFMHSTYLVLLVSLVTCGLFTSHTWGDEVVTKTEVSVFKVLLDARVHEAFAAPDDFYNDVPPPAPKVPPAALVEVKPAIDERLAKRAVWVPGYWEWDADAETFIWTTGTWRFPPPHQRWLPGRWVSTEEGYVRVRGRWIGARIEQLTYVTAPPAYKGRFILPDTLAEDEFWIPGYWVPAAGGKFTWREPVVARRVSNWVWVPAQYLWTPEGWVFVDGYWDYPLHARGQAFASLQLVDPTYEAKEVRVESFAPVPSNAIQESSTGEFVYSVEAFDEKYAFVSTTVDEVVIPETPVIVERVLPETPTAVIRGVVRRGDLTPARIEVQLVGHPAVAMTDEQGRFEIADVPYGIYYVRAVGPVQNHIKRAYSRIKVAENVVNAEFELR